MGDTRQMAAMMKRMGIEMRDVEQVEEVVVRTATKEYRFKRPEVSIMKAQGQETWQIQGKAVASDRAGAAVPPPAVPSVSSAPAAPYAPSPDDVKVVMEAAKVPEAKACEALLATGGDLAEAILRLSA
jgi:nascent polypeptide-associated complex subunit alpha